MPMKYFTPEEMKPSKKTLDLIREFAHSYQVIKIKTKNGLCLN